MEQLTHWKKNNDPRYISGEDLKSGIEIGKGLAPEMAVYICGFEDYETFDQSNNSKVIKTGFRLKTLDGKDVYKPVILNKTNATFCIKEFKSEFIEHWLNKPFVLYAQQDRRHGFVARFRKYSPPATVSPDNAIRLLESCKTQDELKNIWVNLSGAEKNLPSVMAKKELLKTTLK